VGFSVEISPIEAGEFFRASAVPGLETVLEAQKKSAYIELSNSNQNFLLPPIQNTCHRLKQIVALINMDRRVESGFF
jgi:hypothetical protein